MSELNDLLTTRELQRWRLILGEAAETTLCGLDDNARQIDHALEWLYGRDPERLQRGERSGGLGGSNLTTPEWINSIHTLFPQQVIERLESDAVLRYGIEDVVTNLDVLERMQPSESLLRAVLHTKHLMNPEVLAAARQIVPLGHVEGDAKADGGHHRHHKLCKVVGPEGRTHTATPNPCMTSQPSTTPQPAKSPV
jgi:hypothetical protein